MVGSPPRRQGPTGSWRSLRGGNQLLYVYAGRVEEVVNWRVETPNGSLKLCEGGDRRKEKACTDQRFLTDPLATKVGHRRTCRR